jgi:hypothetical protein
LLAVEAARGITAIDELLLDDFSSSERFHRMISFMGQFNPEKKKVSIRGKEEHKPLQMYQL